MNIFEIVALNETVERVPGQNMWRVIYPDEMGRVPDIMPTQEKAQARYDQEVERWNNASGDRQRQEREANQRRTQNERERRKELARQAKAERERDPNFGRTRDRWLRVARGGIRLAGVVVVSYEMWQTCVDRLMRNYRSYANGEYGNIDLDANGEFVNADEGNRAAEVYEAMNARYYGVWTMTVVIPTLRIEIKALLATWRAARRFFNVLRTANAATTVPFAVGGPPGWVAGIIKYILVEASIWAGMYLLFSSDRVKEAVADWVATNWLVGKLAELSGNLLQIHGNLFATALAQSDDWAGWDTSGLQAASSDIRATVGMDDDEIQQRVRDIDTSNGSTSTAPGSYRGPDDLDAAPATTTGAGNSTDWLAPDLR